MTLQDIIDAINNQQAVTSLTFGIFFGLYDRYMAIKKKDENPYVPISSFITGLVFSCFYRENNIANYFVNSTAMALGSMIGGKIQIYSNIFQEKKKMVRMIKNDFD